MFYLRKVYVSVREERAWEKMEKLGEALRERGIEFARSEVPDNDNSSARTQAVTGPGLSTHGQAAAGPGLSTHGQAAAGTGPSAYTQAVTGTDPSTYTQAAAGSGPSTQAQARLASYIAQEGVLWIADSPDVVEALMEREAPVAAYFHEWNREEAFAMAGFALEEPQEVEPEYLERIYRRFAGVPWQILETPRCIVREASLSDAPCLEEIHEDPQSRRFVGGLYTKDPTPEGPEAYRPIFQRYLDEVYGFYGYGIWVVEERRSGTVIGRAGYRPHPQGIPELGYVVAAPYRGQGYAYEACSAILQYGKEELGFTQVQALVEPDNAPSLALCRKLGFRQDGLVEEEGREAMRFLINL